MFQKASLYDDKPALTNDPSLNKTVYFDIKTGEHGEVKRITFDLYAGAVPKTCENFRQLCRGETMSRSGSGKRLWYKGTKFHRVIQNFMVQFGDLDDMGGRGGESIYGNKFADENFKFKHDKPGLLSMANAGPNTNGSQCFITTVPTPHLDGKHVVFGAVKTGMDVLREIENTPTAEGDVPEEDVVIVDCGEIVDGREERYQEEGHKATSSDEDAAAVSEDADAATGEEEEATATA